MNSADDMDDVDDVGDLFAGRPDTVHIEGVGEVPVVYTENEEAPLPPVGPADVFVISPEATWVVLGDEVVVHHVASSTSHVLDRVAALLWQCLDAESTLHDVLSDLADAFGVPLDGIVRDLATVVATWKRDGLVVHAGSSPSLPSVGSRSAAPALRHLVDPPNN